MPLSQSGTLRYEGRALRVSIALQRFDAGTTNLLELGQPLHTVLASTARESDGTGSAFDAFAEMDGGGKRAIARWQRRRDGRMLHGRAPNSSSGHAGLNRDSPRQAS